jgi:hypothetical protein
MASGVHCPESASHSVACTVPTARFNRDRLAQHVPDQGTGHHTHAFIFTAAQQAPLKVGDSVGANNSITGTGNLGDSDAINARCA